MVRAVRGATSVAEDTAEAILESTTELLEQTLERLQVNVALRRREGAALARALADG